MISTDVKSVKMGEPSLGSLTADQSSGGKSSLLSLLLRFYDLQDCHVLNSYHDAMVKPIDSIDWQIPCQAAEGCVKFDDVNALVKPCSQL